MLTFGSVVARMRVWAEPTKPTMYVDCGTRLTTSVVSGWTNPLFRVATLTVTEVWPAGTVTIPPGWL